MQLIRNPFFLSAFGFFSIGIALYAAIVYTQPPKELVTIQVSPKWVNQAQFAGMFVAQQKGIYAKYGINVVFKEFKAGDSVVADIVEGRSQFGYVNPTELLLAREQGNDIQGIAAMYQFSPYVIVSLREDNITSPRQLAGKTIGVKGARGAESETVFALLLASAGLERSDVFVEYLPFGPSEKDDLVEGRADAVGMYRTRLNIFEDEGVLYDVLSPDRYGTPVYNDVIVADTAFLEANPTVARAFLRGTIEGWEYALRNREEAVDITMQYVTDPAYKDLRYQRFILDQSAPLIQPTLQTPIGTMDAARWRAFYGVLESRGVVGSGMNVEEAFTNNYLP